MRTILKLHIKLFISFCLCLGLCISCAGAATLTVAVAANLQPVFGDLQNAFEQTSPHKLRASFNSSGKLLAQIQQGAPFDVFLSADLEHAQHAYQQGWALTAPVVFAQGVLVVWTMRELDVRQWEVLLGWSEIKRIVIANPSSAPYGTLAQRYLEQRGLLKTVQAKLVYAESIAQANQYIHTGVVDLGFTAKSTVMAAAMRGQGRWAEVEGVAHLAQAAVILKKTQQEKIAQEFLGFLNSELAHKIFTRYGYKLP